MMSSPAPALLPLPRTLRAPSSRAPRATVEAPGHQLDIELLLARVTIRGVAGVSSAAVAEYVSILRGDLASAARLVRLNAPTIPAPACIADAVERVLEDEEHDPSTCTDPCCVPEDEHDLYCVDEGSHVLSHGGQYYGVGQW